MQRIQREGQAFSRREVTREEALAELSHEPYKCELLSHEASSAGEQAEGASVEIGDGDITIYDNVRRGGEVAWKDLCRGPHVPNTKVLGIGWSLQRSAAAYWKGSEKNPQLQRVYGTAWPSKEGSRRLWSASPRRSGATTASWRGELNDLFSFPDEIGSGLAVFHPKGGTIRMEMEQYSRERHVAGYDFVNTPHATKGRLFEISGHLDWYSEGMYPPMHLDEERDADGNVTKQGQDYYLKPMNCPHHCEIYKTKPRSYRDLPLRLAEFGTVYRYEQSGELHGLTRVRGFTQDDAHIFCTGSGAR